MQHQPIPTNLTSPRAEALAIRGWRSEFRTWWRMAKHVDVVFDKSSHYNHANNPPHLPPGSISICRECCQILSTRKCDGSTRLTAGGCEYHRDHPGVPIAVKSTIMSVRLRDMFRPHMAMVLYFLEPGKTDLMELQWVRGIREGNKETKKCRKEYVHGERCVWGEDPESIVQGYGVEGVYFRRCDGRYVNGMGEVLEVGGEGEAKAEEEKKDEHQLLIEKILGMKGKPDSTPLDTNLAIGGEQAAEAAWRRINPGEDKEEEEPKPKRRLHCVVM